MTSTGTPVVRRVRIPADGAHFASAFALPLAGLPHRTAEEWARSTFEDTSALLRELLRTGWSGVLGLRLGPRSSARHVIGWRTVECGPELIALEARAPSLTVRNVVTVDGTRLLWATYATFARRGGRARWSLAAPVHHLVVPLLLGRAVRRTA
ncbi:DUF2867 domain-containing protein [Streptomyces diastaticus]|nr:DUF2867 domain-containing protein [Streptomyces diastaticus]